MRPDQDLQWPLEGNLAGHVDSHVTEIHMRSPTLHVVFAKLVVVSIH